MYLLLQCAHAPNLKGGVTRPYKIPNSVVSTEAIA